MEEIVQEQAENDADRDDDPNFDESESTAYNSVITEESKEPQRKQEQEPELGDSMSQSKRDAANEEKIWQQVIDRHGRTEFQLIYSIMDKYRATRFSQNTQEVIKHEVLQKFSEQNIQ